jgi:hypothetical protein
MPDNPSASNKSRDSASIDLVLDIPNAQRRTEDVETEAPTYAYRCGPGVVILRVYNKQSGRNVTEMWAMRRPGRAGGGDRERPTVGAVGRWVAKLRRKMKKWRAGWLARWERWTQ